jgi:hypothetical protein
MVFEASLHAAAAAVAALASRVVTVARPQPRPTEEQPRRPTDQQVTSEASQSKLTTISSGIEVVGLLAKCIILGLALASRSKRSIYKTRPLLYAYDGVHLFNRDSLSLFFLTRKRA